MVLYMHNYFDNLPCAYKKICQITDNGHTETQSLILCAQIPVPIPNKYLGCGYKSFVFVEIMVEEQKTWPRDSQYQNDCRRYLAPNTPKNVGPICLFKPKIWHFRKKTFSGYPLSVYQMQCIPIMYICNKGQAYQARFASVYCAYKNI